jgi:hypothetical protein
LNGWRDTDQIHGTDLVFEHLWQGSDVPAPELGESALPLAQGPAQVVTGEGSQLVVRPDADRSASPGGSLDDHGASREVDYHAPGFRVFLDDAPCQRGLDRTWLLDVPRVLVGSPLVLGGVSSPWPHGQWYG